MAAWLRCPRTTNERRKSYDDQDGAVRVRAKRSGRVLPDAWRDSYRGDYYHRCWKRQRRYHYKLVVVGGES